jgi:tetratricopeptide (TPR) repeat protein
MSMTRDARTILVVAALLITVCATPSLAQQLLTKDSEKIDFAHGLLEQSMFTMAAAQFEEFIQQFPQSTYLEDAYMGAAESQFFLKEYDRAIGLYQKSLEQFPTGKNKGSALVRLGQAFYLTGKYDEAAARLTAVDPAQLTPPFAQTMNFFLGQIRAVQNNPQEAANYFEKAVSVEGATAYTPQAYLQWASALGRLGDHPKALEKAGKALEMATTDDFKVAVMMKQGEIHFLAKQFAESAATFKKVVDTYPALPIVPDAAFNWFTALYNQKLFDELIGHYAQYKDNFQPAYIPVHLIAAKALTASGKNDEALAVLNKLLELPAMTEPQKVKAHLNKIDLLVRSGRFREALDSMDGRFANDPTVKAQFLLLKAQSYMGVQDFDRAWEDYQNIAQQFPDTPEGIEAACSLGHVRYGQAQYEQAGSLFMDCLNKAKDETRRAEALYNAFLSYEKSGVIAKAVETGETYLHTFPKGDHLLDVALMLAGLYSKNQQYEKSIEILNPLTHDPHEDRRQNAYFQIAYNLHLAGKIDEALAGYEKVISEHKTADQVYQLTLKNSFMIYLQQNNEMKAADVLERTIREFPDNDLPLKDYLWLVQYWLDKNESRAMLVVLEAAQKHHAAAPGAVGIKYFTAEAHRIGNNCPEAIKSYDETIAAPENMLYKGRSYLGKGVCLAATGDYPGAKAQFDQAIAVDPEDNFVAMRARFESAHNAELQKNIEEAAKMYMVVAVLYKDPYYSPEALLRAGALFQQLNNNAEAINAYGQIVSVYPQSTQAAAAKETIEKIK